ncbi:MAG: NADH:flavin oxidoreductase/NADH oxidase family protein [Hyphomonadaceae bacterium]|nr:NADH:flavin oxidoreductase/NADH oxidase family protein [Hyphomonadaceae bacterium]
MTNTINTPLTLPSGVELPNRLVKAAMTERLASAGNEVTDRLLQLYKAWGEGGIGLQITGNVQVDRRNLEAPGNVVIDGPPSNEYAVMLGKWAEACKAGGGKVVMQLSHAGRQTQKMVNPTPDAPSAIAVDLPGGQFGTPRAMTADDIERLIEKYAIATKAARAAGFDGVQIHSAHGYLMSQFLSPLTNQRDDEWGGPLENRARMLLSVLKAAKSEAGPGFGVSVKLNSADFQKGGFTQSDSTAVIGMLNDLDLDFVEISGGNYEQPKMMDMEGLKPVHEDGARESTKKREAYFLDYAREVQTVAKMPLMVTGGFRTLAGMNDALAGGEADLIGLGRPLCVDVDAPAQLLSGALTELPKWEKTLRIGPGIFGPNSSIGLFKALNGFGMQGWFYTQLHRIADGMDPNRKLGVLSAFLKMQGIDSRMAKAYHADLAARETV